MKSSLLSSSRRLRASNTSEGARLSSSKIIQSPRRSASTNTPSLKTSRPSLPVMYPPTYSCTSVCSWLLIRIHLKPHFAARNSIIDVLPTLVGPCSNTAVMSELTARAKSRIFFSTVSVITNLVMPLSSGSDQSTATTGPRLSQYGFTSTHSSPEDWRPPGRGGGKVILFPPFMLRHCKRKDDMNRRLDGLSCVWKLRRNPSNRARDNGRNPSSMKELHAFKALVSDRRE